MSRFLFSFYFCEMKIYSFYRPDSRQKKWKPYKKWLKMLRQNGRLAMAPLQILQSNNNKIITKNILTMTGVSPFALFHIPSYTSYIKSSIVLFAPLFSFCPFCLRSAYFLLLFYSPVKSIYVVRSCFTTVVRTILSWRYYYSSYMYSRVMYICHTLRCVKSYAVYGKAYAGGIRLLVLNGIKASTTRRMALILLLFILNKKRK